LRPIRSEIGQDRSPLVAVPNLGGFFFIAFFCADDGRRRKHDPSRRAARLEAATPTRTATPYVNTTLCEPFGDAS
jgi:hypothetical protein